MKFSMEDKSSSLGEDEDGNKINKLDFVLTFAI